jgi:hypothetical protein
MLGAGETRTLDIAEESPPAHQTPEHIESPVERPTPVPSHGPGTPAWIAFGIAGAGAAAALAVGGFAIMAQSTYNGDPTRAHADSFYRLRDIGTVVGSVAVAAAATGVVLWMVRPSAPGGAVGLTLDVRLDAAPFVLTKKKF